MNTHQQPTEQAIFFSMNPNANTGDFKAYILQRIELAEAWIKNGNNPESNRRWVETTEAFLKENPEAKLTIVKPEPTTVKNWYQKEYGDFSVSCYLRKNLKFETVLRKMQEGEEIYSIIFRDDYSDSIVRERVFEKLSELADVPYEVIYQLWLNPKS